jgi:hypothetical protein
VPDESGSPIVNDLVSSLVPSLRPMLVNDLLPAIQRDAALQERIGAAIGRELAAQYRTQVNVGVAALVTIAVALVALAGVEMYEAIAGD